MFAFTRKLDVYYSDLLVCKIKLAFTDTFAFRVPDAPPKLPTFFSPFGCSANSHVRFAVRAFN